MDINTTNKRFMPRYLPENDFEICRKYRQNCKETIMKLTADSSAVAKETGETQLKFSKYQKPNELTRTVPPPKNILEEKRLIKNFTDK